MPPTQGAESSGSEFKDKTPARTARGKNWQPDYENLTKPSRSLVTEVSGLPGSLGQVAGSHGLEVFVWLPGTAPPQ